MITMERSSMGRTRPLLMAVVAQRRRENMQGGPGAIPNGGQGALGRGGIARNNGGRFQGTKRAILFWAGVEVFLHRQDCPLPQKRLVYHVLEDNLTPNLIV